MATLIDSYNEVPYGGDRSIGSTDTAYGQSFLASANYTLTACRFYLRKHAQYLPTGSAYAKIYTHSGTYGTNSVPTGDPLATSGAIDVTTLSVYPDYAWVSFTFSGENQIALVSGTRYVVAVEYTGSGTSLIQIELDASSPSHGGNSSYLTGSWVSYPGWDLAFEVYGEEPTSPIIGTKYALPPFAKA